MNERGKIVVLPQREDDLDPLVAELGNHLDVGDYAPTGEPEDRATPVFIDLRRAPPSTLDDLVARDLRVIAVAPPTDHPALAQLDGRLLALIDPHAPVATSARAVVAAVRTWSSWWSAFEESENVVEIQQEVLKAAGETFRLKEELEQRTAELREAQEQIQRTRHLTALGSLSAGFAHELNNPLTGVLGLMHMVCDKLGPEHPLAELVGQVAIEAKRAANLVTQFLEFADTERFGHASRVVVGRVIAEALTLLTDRCQRQNIEVVVNVGAQSPEVLADPVSLREAFTHLMRNAVQVMPGGGTLTVTVRNVGSEAVRIAFRDTGPGVPADLHERIFDPFFTTKATAEQVGLGLSITHRIIDAHHGRIWVEDPVGGGAELVIVLPAAPEAAHLV